MHDHIKKQLDKVISLHQEKNQVINRFKTLEKKKIGSHILMITKEEKDKQIDKASKLYDARINAVYIKLNMKLKKEGFEELENPYKTN